MRRSYVVPMVWGGDIGRWGARRGLKSKSTNYPDHGHHGDPPPTRKIPMVEPGIEPRTSWLVVRSTDHYTTRLVRLCEVYPSIWLTTEKKALKNLSQGECHLEQWKQNIRSAVWDAQGMKYLEAGYTYKIKDKLALLCCEGMCVGSIAPLILNLCNV